jgi:hypothetical protein
MKTPFDLRKFIKYLLGDYLGLIRDMELTDDAIKEIIKYKNGFAIFGIECHVSSFEENSGKGINYIKFTVKKPKKISHIYIDNTNQGWTWST